VLEGIWFLSFAGSEHYTAQQAILQGLFRSKINFDDLEKAKPNCLILKTLVYDKPCPADRTIGRRLWSINYFFTSMPFLYQFLRFTLHFSYSIVMLNVALLFIAEAKLL